MCFMTIFVSVLLFQMVAAPPPNPSPTLLITVVKEVSPITFHTVRQEFIKCTIWSAFLGSLSGTQGCAIAAEESPEHHCISWTF